MDTQNSAVVDVPDFKLAKVGKDRERKRGGAGWMGARGAGSAFSGAAGGAGGGVLGTSMSLGKLLMTLLVAGGVSAGAWQMGTLFSANNAAGRKPDQKKIFSDKDTPKYSDTSGVIKADNSIPNSLGYVSGSTDGLTPEERAKKAEADAAAAKAAEDAQKKADEEAQKKADEDASKAPPTADPAAALSAAGDAAKKGLGSGKFGKLNSSFGGGGGLSGGAGLSGGINRNFGAMDSFGKKGVPGALTAMRSPSRPSSSAAPHQALGKSNAKGFARQQLDTAFAASRAATGASKSESAQSSAAAPFDNNQAGGSVISGPGVGAGATTGPADSAPNAASSSGGPIGSSAGCPRGYSADSSGNCNPISTPNAKNAAPYQWMIDAVKILMAIVALVALYLLYIQYVAIPAAIAAAAASFGAGSAAVEALLAQAKVLDGIILGLGLAISALGLMIIGASGDIMMGGIITAIGGFIAASELVPGMISSTTTIPEVAAGGLIMAAGGYMAAANVKPPMAQ